MGNGYYDKVEIWQITQRTREICQNPFKLFTAYCISCLADSLDDGEEFSVDDMWGTEMDKDVLLNVVKYAVEDFESAVKNRIPVKVFGNTYTIRGGNSLPYDKFMEIFDFDESENGLVISKGKIRNFEAQCEDNYEDRKEELKRSKEYYRKISDAGKTDDGWDRLTDIEAAWYCWGLFCLQNHDSDNDVSKFHEKYKDSYCLELDDLLKCTNHGRLDGIYSFSVKKVTEWNKRNKQESSITL